MPFGTRSSTEKHAEARSSGVTRGSSLSSRSLITYTARATSPFSITLSDSPKWYPGIAWRVPQYSSPLCSIRVLTVAAMRPPSHRMDRLERV